MANELRVRQIAVGGLVEDNPLTSSATTLTSAGLAAVTGSIGSTQHLAIVLDPDGIDGAPEIVYVTALTAGAGSGTIARGKEGTTARQHVAGTAWVHAPTPTDMTGLIGLNVYEPGTTATYTNATSTIADVDATNMAVSFVTPPSGKVLVRLSAYLDLSTNADYARWGLREGTTTLKHARVQSMANSTTSAYASMTFYITGLTAGDVHTYKWAFSAGSGTTAIYVGGATATWPAAVMEVIAAP